jgi:nitrite reductase/ring-hydroxylating ferredoxin subunit
MHVVLGAMQSEQSVLYTILTSLCIVVVPTLHILASRQAQREAVTTPGRWLDAGALDDIADGRGQVVTPRQGEQIAIFRFGDQLSAISNVCAHQGGPLGEGRIINGCITCPWHGYQYRPEDGCAPPPFAERLPTYALRIENGRVLVNVDPFPPGAPAAPIPANAPQAELAHA